MEDPVANPTLVETRDELRANVLQFAKDAQAIAGRSSASASAIANGCSHAVEWVAFEDDTGTWTVAFCKYAGYNKLTFKEYDRLRRDLLTGTDTKRRVEKLGGVYYGVGVSARLPNNHPAVAAVKAMCALFGKTPKQTAKVRVFTSEERPAAMDILVAAIRAADLSAEELKRLFEEVRRSA